MQGLSAFVLPIGMLVAPSPVFPLFFAIRPAPVVILAVLPLEIVAVGALLLLVPLMVVTTIRIVIPFKMTMFILGAQGDRREQCSR